MHRLIQLTIAMGMAIACMAAARAASEFEAVSFDGRNVSLKALKGKAAVLMFFSTDCQHCQQTSMTIDPIYRELRSKGFEIVGLSLNKTDTSGLRTFASRYGASFPLVISSRGEFSRIAGISLMLRIYYPYILFIDKNGTIQEEHQGSERAWFENLDRNFRSAVEKLLK